MLLLESNESVKRKNVFFLSIRNDRSFSFRVKEEEKMNKDLKIASKGELFYNKARKSYCALKQV